MYKMSVLLSRTRHILCKSLHHRSMSTPPSSSAVSVAFIGLGNMGKEMALNLAKQRDDELSRLQFTVYDMNDANISAFMKRAESDGINSTDIQAASDLTTIADANPDFVVTSLPTCEASEIVVGNIVNNLPPSSGNGCLFIDTSTISPAVSKKLHDQVKSVSPNHDYVDSPVSGGVKGAADATLTFMTGCSSEESFQKIQPLLKRMGKAVLPCGASGSGSAVKLCNNAALAAQMIGICEAMSLGDSLGVDPRVLAAVMNVSTAKCWSSEVNNPHPIAAKAIGSGASANDYEGGFGTALMLKDLNLALDAAVEEGMALPVTGLSRDLYHLANKHGLGNKDFGVMLQFLKGNTSDK
jgi:3-hydroxyisobutyrate dehydrogenase